MRCGQDGELAADLPHDLRGQVPPGLAVLGFFGHVIAVQGELIAQPGRRAAGPGRAQLPRRDQELADLAAGQYPGERADLAGGVQVAEAAKEHLDVLASQHCRAVAVIRALAQAIGQQRQAGQVVASLVPAAAAPPPGQVGQRPDLGRLAQPRLGDGGERQAAALPEQHHVPGVPGDLGLRAGHATAHMGDHRVHHAQARLATPGGDNKAGE